MLLALQLLINFTQYVILVHGLSIFLLIVKWIPNGRRCLSMGCRWPGIVPLGPRGGKYTLVHNHSLIHSITPAMGHLGSQWKHQQSEHVTFPCLQQHVPVGNCYNLSSLQCYNSMIVPALLKCSVEDYFGEVVIACCMISAMYRHWRFLGYRMVRPWTKGAENSPHHPPPSSTKKKTLSKSHTINFFETHSPPPVGRVELGWS